MRRVRRSSGSSGARAVAALALFVLSACSLTTEADETPRTARVRIEGTSPHPLMLITSKDLFEQQNPLTGAVNPVLNVADTLKITLPYDATLDISSTGSVYVELRNLLVPTASVHMRVDLDNGQGYDQRATLSDDAALIYYYIFNDWSYR